MQPRDPAGRFAARQANQAFNDELRAAAGFGPVEDVEVPGAAETSEEPSGGFDGGQGGITGGGYQPPEPTMTEQIRNELEARRGH